MRTTCVVGVGMTRFGRFLDRPLADLAGEAACAALADAGVETGDVAAVIFANATQGVLEGQHGIRGQAALDGFGFGRAPVVNVENACASASTALHLAHVMVASGAYECVLALGAEKMAAAEPAKSMAAFEGSWDLRRREQTLASLLAMGQGVSPPPGVEAPGPHSVFMDVYAAFCRHHMARFGTTQRQMAAVSAKNHGHSVENPRAQYRRAFTVDEVLAARAIVWPLTLPMCSPVSDGAAAALVCTLEYARRLGSAREVAIRSSVLMSGERRDPDALEDHVARDAARRAYEQAGIGPADIDVVECHDATAFGEILQSEMLGFFDLGEGGPAAERGETALGGRIPFNPSGGLESKGHPIGATGLGQVYEIVSQLRGEAGARQVPRARIGLVENGGGLRGVEEAAVAITILEGSGR